jgi:uncharacterized protein
LGFIIIPLIAAAASLLTFFSGFGLGTLLTPVFALFFPIELAIGLTAIVHFLNGLFKLFLIGRFARLNIVIRFGVPATLAALAGAWTLGKVSDLDAIYSYSISGKVFTILPVKLILATLIASFTLFELIPKLTNLEIDKKYLSFGGLLSGFFGGLSGHQGALRSAFLARAGLTKEEFIGTGAVISSCIDVARISVYVKELSNNHLNENVPLLALTTLFAFSGAFIGNKLLKKITMKGVQKFVSISLLLLSLALGAGII